MLIRASHLQARWDLCRSPAADVPSSHLFAQSHSVFTPMAKRQKGGFSYEYSFCFCFFRSQPVSSHVATFKEGQNLGNMQGATAGLGPSC